MPWKYSENMWKMATGKEWDELIQYHNKENQEDKVYNNKRDEKYHNVNTNDDVDNWTTQHINDCVASTNSSTERAPVVLFLAHFIHTHIGSSSSLVRTSLVVIHMSSMWLSSLRLELHSLLPSLPPVCLPLHLLPPQRRAAAGAQQEDHGKPLRLRQQLGWGHLRRPLPPHRNYRMKSIVWMTQDIFKDAESVRSGPSHVPSVTSTLSWSRRDAKPSSGIVFANPRASSSSPYPGGFNPWISNVTERKSPHVTSERQNPDTTLDPRCQSGPSARYSFVPNEVRFSQDYGADQQRLQISELHFDKFLTPTTFACWKIRFKTEVRTCSQFPTEAMLWIKEVEMVESVMIWNLRVLSKEVMVQTLSCSTQHWPLQEKGQSEEVKAHKKPFPSRKTDCLHWSTNTSGSLGPMILSRITPSYLLLLFEMMIFRSSIQNRMKFCCRWHKSQLMTSWKICTDWKREPEKLKTVLKLYNMEIHQKKAGPDYHKIENCGEKKYRARHSK